MQNIVICALYKFVALEKHTDLQKPLLLLMTENNIKGTILLSQEGINGSVAALQQGINTLLAWLQSDDRFKGLGFKLSYHDDMPFLRTRVKLKREIVTMGVEDIDPNKSAGTYVKPKHWNQLISDPDVLVIDTRNDYEVAIGTFKNAINPKTNTFKEFPSYAAANLDTVKHKKIAMFCTGGIRCEKSTAYLREQGFEDVYHLEGGILKYLEEVPEQESLWQGECFVFDERVSVNQSLEKGRYHMCHGCRHPITDEDKKNKHYTRGVSCPYCYDQLTDDQFKRFTEREKQINLAKLRKQSHLGSNPK